jgi:hypothetical protein
LQHSNIFYISQENFHKSIIFFPLLQAVSTFFSEHIHLKADIIRVNIEFGIHKSIWKHNFVKSKEKLKMCQYWEEDETRYNTPSSFPRTTAIIITFHLYFHNSFHDQFSIKKMKKKNGRKLRGGGEEKENRRWWVKGSWEIMMMFGSELETSSPFLEEFFLFFRNVCV